MGELRIGTSGWNYPRGRGTWNGIFYPTAAERSEDFDELRFYAAHFNTVEVNSTFYGQPRAEVTRGWAARTPSDFEFSVKLYQKFTHPRMFEETLRKSLKVPSIDAESMKELAQPNAADLDEFRRGIEPLANAGKLGALLAQFPPSFKNGDVQREYLSGLLHALHDHRVAVELRHRSWSDAFDTTIGLLNSFAAAWVQIDEPKFRVSIRQNYLPNIRGFYYLRLHGRNAKQWWHHKESDDRYNYFYSAEELQEFSDTVDAARRIVKKAYLYTNNHFSAQSVANAAMIKQQLGQPLPGEYPAAFVKRYPMLAGVVKTRRATVQPRVLG